MSKTVASCTRKALTNHKTRLELYIRFTAELRLHHHFWPHDGTSWCTMVTHCKHVMTVCKIARALVYLFQRFLYRAVYFTYIHKHKALASYLWPEVNDIDIIDSSASWLIPTKHHCHVVINGSKWEEGAGRWSWSSGGRGWPFTYRTWCTTVFIIIPIIAAYSILPVTQSVLGLLITQLAAPSVYS